MEEVYLRNFKKCLPLWCSDKINLRAYFDDYSNSLRPFKLREIKHVAKKLCLPYAETFSDENLADLGRELSTRHLVTYKYEELQNPGEKTNLEKSILELPKKKLLKPLSEQPPQPQPSTSGSLETQKKVTITASKAQKSKNNNKNKSSTIMSSKLDQAVGGIKVGKHKKSKKVHRRKRHKGKKRVTLVSKSIKKNFRKTYKIPVGGRDVLQEIKPHMPLYDITPKFEYQEERSGEKDLFRWKDFIVAFRIHEPYFHRSDNSRPGKCVQEIWMLANHSLEKLRDKIFCECDFQEASAEISEHPDSSGLTLNKDIYPSSLFYFDNTFYYDNRHPRCKDYSEEIRTWGKKKGIPLGGSRPMDEMLVGDLQVRLGYPYVFIHQGNCEHVVIISDARFLSSRDSLHDSDYPIMTRFKRRNMKYCSTCSKNIATHVVYNSEKLVHDFDFQCTTCFKQGNYINGKKNGNFKAWKYYQQGMIL